MALRAGRRAGELLGQMEKAKPGPAAAPKPAKPAVKPEPRQDPSRDARDLEAPTLGELGITYSESSRLQALASLPAPAFEAHISDVKAKGEELTTAGALREAARV